MAFEMLESRIALTSLPPAFLFNVKAGVSENTGFVTSTTLQENNFGGTSDFHITEGDSWDSGDTEFALDLSHWGPWESNMRSSFEVTSTNASATVRLEQLLSYDADIRRNPDPPHNPFFFNSFGSGVYVYVLVRGPSVDEAAGTVPVMWTIDAANHSPSNIYYNFSVYRPASSPFIDLRGEATEKTEGPIDTNFSSGSLVYEGYRYYTAAYVHSGMGASMGLSSSIPASGYQWTLDTFRDLTLTVTRLDVNTPIPYLKSINVKPGFEVQPRIDSDGQSLEHAPTTTKPVVLEAIVSANRDSLNRYEISSLMWTIDYSRESSASQVIDDFQLVATIEQEGSDEIELVYESVFTPGPGLHGSDNLATSYLGIRDKFTGDWKLDVEKETFDLLFVKMSWDPPEDGEWNLFHAKNWFRYWAENQDAAASHPGNHFIKNNVEYRYGGKHWSDSVSEIIGEKPETKYGWTLAFPGVLPIINLYDAAATTRFTEELKARMFGSKLNALLPTLQSGGLTGVDFLESVIAHESAHAWLQLTFGTRFLYFRGLHPDSDMDGLPDVLEEQYSHLGFDKNNANSFNSPVKTDEEAFAVLVQFEIIQLDMLNAPERESDFANPGSKTVPMFFREAVETGTNAKLNGHLHFSWKTASESTLISALAVNVGVEVVDSGTYTVSSTLQADNGTTLEIERLVDLGPGIHDIELLLDGGDLRLHKLVGQLEVTEVHLLGDQVYDFAQPGSRTASYHFTQFTPKSTVAIGETSFHEVSDDGSSEHQKLEYRVDFDTFGDLPDNLFLEGLLWSESGRFLGHAITSVAPNADHEILRFGAENVLLNEIEGRVILRGVYLRSDGELVDQTFQEVQSVAFNARDLGAQIVRTEEPFLVTGHDDSSNGALDRVSVAGSVDVMVDGDYFIFADLQDSSGSSFKAGPITQNLSGRREVNVDFLKQQIVDARAVGPFSVSLSIFNQDERLVFATQPRLTLETAGWTDFIADEIPPTSLVHSLPEVHETPEFSVTWTGSDNENGVGIAFYDIYVSVDGGPFVIWQSEVSESPAAYIGEPGRSYAFVSIATDHAGNRELKELAADAETSVRSTDGIVLIDEDFENETVSGFTMIPEVSETAKIVSGDSFGPGNHVYQMTYNHDEETRLLQKWGFESETLGVEFAVKLPDGIPNEATDRQWANFKNFHVWTTGEQGREVPIGLFSVFNKYNGAGPNGTDLWQYDTFTSYDGQAWYVEIEPPIDQWLHVRYFMRWNQPGSADGELMIWLNDELVVQADDVEWLGAEDDVLDGFWIGGNISLGGEQPDRPFRRWFDDIVVTVDGEKAPVLQDSITGTYWGRPLVVHLLEQVNSVQSAIDPNSVQITSAAKHGSLTMLGDGRMEYVADEGFVGEDRIEFTVRDVDGRVSNIASLTIRVVGSPLLNPLLPVDVDNDGRIEALDALLVINRMNRMRTPSIAVEFDAIGPPYLDVNGDGRISPVDALLVINELNRLRRAVAVGILAPQGETGFTWRSGVDRWGIVVPEEVTSRVPLAPESEQASNREQPATRFNGMLIDAVFRDWEAARDGEKSDLNEEVNLLSHPLPSKA